MYYEEVDGKSCLTTPPTRAEIVVGDIVTITTLTKEAYWMTFLKQFGLTDSRKTNHICRLQSHGKTSDSTGALIGRFNVTNTKVCCRLCMRVDMCQSFIVEPGEGEGQSQPCSLYTDISLNFINRSGAKFYVNTV